MADGSTHCDLCQIPEGAEPYPDVPVVATCPRCTALLDGFRRGDVGHFARWSGPMPRMTAFRLGQLAPIFPDAIQARLERFAATLSLE